MARTRTLRTTVLIAVLALLGNPGSSPEEPARDTTDTLRPLMTVGSSQPSTDQQALVDFALGRFEAQGLSLPKVEFVFHETLMPCHGHKGMYHKKTRTLEMCSMDKHTMLHELAHAWANENLTTAQMDEFVSFRGLDSWNDHDHAWERRGTEHVAETIAWALMDEPGHVKWVETLEDGSIETTHRILTLGVDVEILHENFEIITGQIPMFRDPGEWSTEATEAKTSPELARLGG